MPQGRYLSSRNRLQSHDNINSDILNIISRMGPFKTKTKLPRKYENSDTISI